MVSEEDLKGTPTLPTSGGPLSGAGESAGLREKAERTARDVELREAESLSPGEVREMFHELQVHQVELQIQNEELRNTQAELEVSRERYFDLYDLAPVGYCTLSEEGLVIGANLTAATMLGVTRTTLVGTFFSRVVAPEDQGKYYSYLRSDAFGDTQPVKTELRMRAAGGSVFWARISSLLSCHNEQPVCRVAITDITESKDAEEELARYRAGLEDLVRERTAQLEEANDRLRKEVAVRKKTENALLTLQAGLEQRVEERTAELEESQEQALRQKEEIDTYYNASPIGLVAFDRDLRCLRINRRLAGAFGLTLADCIGRNLRDLVPPSLADHLEPSLQRVLEKGEPLKDLEYSDEHRLPPKVQGTWIENLEPVRDESGRIMGVAVAVQDITELRGLEARLRQSQKMEALGTLVGGIAHDFNNILAAMIGFAELVKEHLPEESRESRHAARILAAGVRGRDLVRQMLTFSRSTGGEKKAIYLVDIVEEAGKLLRASTPSTITLTTRTTGRPGPVLADPTQIHQIVMNLVTNAVHALRETGGAITIDLSREEICPEDATPHLEQGSYTKLTVRDNGAGMPPEIIDRIFDPFFTTKGVGEGTGLGLSVVLGIVKESHGHIAVASDPGKGTTFDVYLPVIEETAGTSDTLKDLSIPTGHERILFVDDEPALAEMGTELLTGLGYLVASHTDSRTAMALFRLDPSRFDLVITDQTMPTMTGMELAKEMLAIRPDLPVILCTGFSETATRESALADGVKTFLMKPLTKREIAVTVRKVLDGS
jgi:PAS domain S-box-containing protein